MAVIAAVRWESMQIFDPDSFAKFDLVKDNIYPGDLCEQRKLRELTHARVKNNALLALRWRRKKPTAAQMGARRHIVCSSRSMSNFKLDKTIVYRNKRSTGLSCLETLPSTLLCNINLLLDDEVDKVCLSLSSKVLAATMRQFWARRLWCSHCGGYHTDDDGDERIYDWYDLAMRLADSIQESLQFCHHCLLFLPKFTFDNPTAEIDALVCLDCLRLTAPRYQYQADDCDGCHIFYTLLDSDYDGGAPEGNSGNSSITHLSNGSLCGNFKN